MGFFRICYKIEITLASPLSIGSGLVTNTDSDVITDSNGVPFIPATSIAGVMRDFIGIAFGKQCANDIFGFIPSSTEENEKAKAGKELFAERESRIIVYDGQIVPDNKNDYFISTRDMVALKDGVPVKGAKFDMETVETGAAFISFIELMSEDAVNPVESAFSALNEGIIGFGSKTTRGYGKVKLRVWKKAVQSIDEWIEYDPTAETTWINELTLLETAKTKLTIGLASVGGVSIREYTTDPSAETVMPDYVTTRLHSGECLPVIPGTSWAGSFRSQCLKYRNAEFCNGLFGFVNPAGDKVDALSQKSVVIFSESQLSGGNYKTITRNAIDRFSGGTKNGALYTEKTYYGGETTLEIIFRRLLNEDEIKVISACIADLHNGFLAVGGLTSVGRGMFSIKSINGKKLDNRETQPDTIYSIVRNIMIEGSDQSE